MTKRTCYVLCLLIFVGQRTYAQDTLHLTLHQFEEQFLRNNLGLLAAKCNITIAQAQVAQAKLYNNPTIQFNGNAYNPVNKKPLDITNNTGQYDISAQQLIVLAGKRSKQIKIAETNVAMTEERFYDLLRTLRSTLRSDFYKALFLHNSIQAYRTPISSLEKLNATYDTLLKKGTVTLKDAVRIRSLLYSMRSEQTLLQNQFNDVESELQTLVKDINKWYIPQSSLDFSTLSFAKIPPLKTLIDSAYIYRPDLKLAEDALLSCKQNYTLQKAMAIPDLTIGGEFDKRGSFVENASFFSASIDLPLFNRNQGNIRAAKTGIEQGKLQLEKQQLEIESDVQHAYMNVINTQTLLRSIDPRFRNQFEDLLKSITTNFEKKNLTLLEFTDMYESYKENIVQINDLQNDMMQAIENLNFSIGKPIIDN